MSLYAGIDLHFYPVKSLRVPLEGNLTGRAIIIWLFVIKTESESFTKKQKYSERYLVYTGALQKEAGSNRRRINFQLVLVGGYAHAFSGSDPGLFL